MKRRIYFLFRRDFASGIFILARLWMRPCCQDLESETFRDFAAQNHIPCLGIFLCKKVNHWSGTSPYTILLGEYRIREEEGMRIKEMQWGRGGGVWLQCPKKIMKTMTVR